MFTRSAVIFFVKRYAVLFILALVSFVIFWASLLLPDVNFLAWVVGIIFAGIFLSKLLPAVRLIRKVKVFSDSESDRLLANQMQHLCNEVSRKLKKGKQIYDQVQNILNFCFVCHVKFGYKIDDLQTILMDILGENNVTLTYEVNYLDRPNERKTPHGRLVLKIHDVKMEKHIF